VARVASATSSAGNVRRRAPATAIAGLCGIVLDLRLVAAALTVIQLVRGGPSFWLGVALSVVITTSYLPLRRWERLGPVLLRHPALLAVDVLVAVAVLGFVGVASPFVYYALGTAVLAGVLHGRRGVLVFSPLLVIGHWTALAVHSGSDLEVSFQALVGLPGLYPLVGVSGAALRRILDREAAAAAALRETAGAASAAEERIRLAREMHDSLGKSLRGIAIAATALPRWIQQRPERAAAEAARLAQIAETAADEARALIGALRADTSAGPTGQAVSQIARQWATDHQTTLTVDVDDSLTVTPEVRHELLRVLMEALENVARHAKATAVGVALQAVGGHVVLRVTDDGAGFDPPRSLTRLQRDGHYGLVGMHERARRAGGRLRVSARRTGGTSVTLLVPLDGEPAPHQRPAIGPAGPGKLGLGALGRPGGRWIAFASARRSDSK
jgi:signal transduction histidine kinase